MPTVAYPWIIDEQHIKGAGITVIHLCCVGGGKAQILIAAKIVYQWQCRYH